MKIERWQLVAGLALLLLSAATYAVHYLIFRDWAYIGSYMLAEIAFLPIEVLLVSIIIHKLVTERERGERLEKLNMVIGVFFSELGTDLLSTLASHDPKISEVRDALILTQNETDEEFAAVAKRLAGYRCDIDMQRVSLGDMRGALICKRDFLVRLLENPVLLEHESFTGLLFAVFHLIEELAHRDRFENMPPADLAHLKGDMARVYSALLKQWLMYMKHLKGSYPYLFSLALRTNPFDERASVAFR